LTIAEQMADFVGNAAFDRLSAHAIDRLKLHTLDAIGCAIGAIGRDVMNLIRAQLDDFGGAAKSSLIGGGLSAPDRAAFYNGALVRYLDFNDSYLAKGETCHPSDNIAAVLAAGEYAQASGQDFLTALAAAYEIQCRLSEAAPVRAKGFDHTTQGAYSVAAGVAKILKLEKPRIAHALAMSGTAYNALRVTRTGELSHWKGLAFPNTACGATHAAFLAMRGVTGPLSVIEGRKGFIEAIAGPFQIDWKNSQLDSILRASIKRFNAEIHSQSTIEAILDLRGDAGFRLENLDHLRIEIFDVAYNIIGGGDEGNKQNVRTKEQADHSLPYIAAVALLDGCVMPEQYEPERITRGDVQELMRRVEVIPSEEFSRSFPEEMRARVTATFKDGRERSVEKRQFEGYFTRPMNWDSALAKFDALTAGRLGTTVRNEIVELVKTLETCPTSLLGAALRRVKEVNHD